EVEEVVPEPGQGLEQVDEHEQQEHAGHPTERRALGKAGGLLLDLGLRQLDLLADEERGLLRDLVDDLAQRFLGAAGWRPTVAARHQSPPPSLFRIFATTKPPANAAPMSGSGSPPESAAACASQG